MLFDVKVVERAEYEAHIAALKATGQIGLLDTGRVDHNADGKQGHVEIDRDPIRCDAATPAPTASTGSNP